MSDPVIDHLSANGFLRTRKILMNNFLGGLAWGFGSVIGATIFVFLLISLLRMFNFLPGFSGLADQVNSTIHHSTNQVIDQTGN